MARAGKVVRECLDMLACEVRPGITTEELDRLAEKFIRSKRGVPTFKGYHGFPGSICASPNAMVVHGIPGPVRLQKGDIIGIDIGGEHLQLDVTLRRGDFLAEQHGKGIGLLTRAATHDPDTQRVIGRVLTA